jgi:hypothetical protein
MAERDQRGVNAVLERRAMPLAAFGPSAGSSPAAHDDVRVTVTD